MSILLCAIDALEMAGLFHVTSPDPWERGADGELPPGRRSADRCPSPSVIMAIGVWLLGSDPALALTDRYPDTPDR